MQELPAPWDWTHGPAPYCHCPHGPHGHHGPHHGPPHFGFHGPPHFGFHGPHGHHGHHGPHGPAPPPWCHCYEELVKNEIQRRKDESKRLENEGYEILKNAKNKEECLKAKSKFDEAWKLYNGEASLLTKIKECDCLICVKKGDELFNSQNLISASSEYNRALTIANEAKITNLINQSKELLNKTQNEIIRIENEKIEKIKREEIERKKREAEQKLRKQREEEARLRRIEEEQKEKLRQQQLEFMRKKQEEEKRIQKEKEERIKKEKIEMERKIQRANTKFENEINYFISEEKGKLKSQLLLSQIALIEIQKFINNNKEKLIDNLLLKKQGKNIFDNINHILNKSLIKDTSNILLIGETGVGKSTLINSILELPPEKMAKTGSIEPCIMGAPKFYSSEKIKGIKLIDTRGYEKDKGYLIDKMEKEIIQFINEQKFTEQPIHLIWYCFKGSRFEDSEDITIKNIQKLNIPVLLVYTQAITDEIMDFEMISNKGYEYVKILAKDMGQYAKSYGLDNLKLKSNEYINTNNKTTVKDIIIAQYINSLKKKIISQVDESKNNLNKDNFNLKIYDLINFIYCCNKIDLSPIKNKIDNIIENYVISFIKNNSENLAYSLLNIQQKVNIEFNGILSNLKNKEQWKEFIIDNFKNELIIYCTNNIIDKIYNEIAQVYLEYLDKEYKNYLEKNYFINDLKYKFGNFN